MHIHVYVQTTRAGTVARGRGFDPVQDAHKYCFVYNNPDHFCLYLLKACATIVMGKRDLLTMLLAKTQCYKLIKFMSFLEIFIR